MQAMHILGMSMTKQQQTCLQPVYFLHALFSFQTGEGFIEMSTNITSPCVPLSLAWS